MQIQEEASYTHLLRQIIIEVCTMDYQQTTQQSSNIAELMHQEEEDPMIQKISQMLWKIYLVEAKKNEGNPYIGQELARKAAAGVEKFTSMAASSEALSQPSPPPIVRVQSKKKSELQQPRLVRHTEKMDRRKRPLQSSVEKAADRDSKKEVKKKGGNKSKTRAENPIHQTPEFKHEIIDIQSLSPIMQKYQWQDYSRSSKRHLVYDETGKQQELHLSLMQSSKNKKEQYNAPGSQNKYETPVKKEKKRSKTKERKGTPPLKKPKPLPDRSISAVATRPIPLPIPQPHHRKHSPLPKPARGSRPNHFSKPQDRTYPKPAIGSRTSLPPKNRTQTQKSVKSVESKPRSGGRGKSK